MKPVVVERCEAWSGDRVWSVRARVRAGLGLAAVDLVSGDGFGWWFDCDWCLGCELEAENGEVMIVSVSGARLQETAAVERRSETVMVMTMIECSELKLCCLVESGPHGDGDCMFREVHNGALSTWWQWR
ncbi:hypothetical protein M0R45_002316 [Rubus argutus]|uniref:Uncharacterized protein n=1 Tax=Rubus argutus TaxID=59490 RepID=A0AAW1VEE2_RUBAR